MANLPRFHRRKKDVAPPTLITNNLPRKSTQSSSELPVSSPRRSFQKFSPFRVFHRSSGKRARDSPPESSPHSPAAAPAPPADCTDGRPVSPVSLKMETASDEPQKPTKQYKMPSFLCLSDEEISNRFSELVWRERHRLMLSITNPSPNFRWARVTGPHLKTLDRYGNIQPWHNNRIKLRVPEGHVDYVNASPIVLEPLPCPAADGGSGPGAAREPDRYIAMQGPKQASMDHVWRMLVEQLESPGVVVMLTETHEGPTEKCFPYFPRSKDEPPVEVNEHDEFGDGFRATVRCEGLEETPAGDAIELRKLVIRVHSPGRTTPAQSQPDQGDPSSSSSSSSRTESSQQAAVAETNKVTPADQQQQEQDQQPSTSEEKEREKEEEEGPYEEKVIYHFLYKKWPDFGVPSLDDLDSFFTLMRLSREKNASPRNPRVVHCSAGVGRSGTFIALEYLMRELDAGALEDWDERAAGAGPDSKITPSPDKQVEEKKAEKEGEEEKGEAKAAAAEEEKKEGKEEEDQGGEEGEGLELDSESESIEVESREEPPHHVEGPDLIFETVDSLREQRRTMVQAELQYLFIYRVLRQLWIEKYGPPQEEGQEEGGKEEDGEGKEVMVDADRNGDGDGERAAKRLEVEPSTEQ